MTKEELKKEAEEYALNTYEMCSYSDLPYASDRRAREQAFIAGAEPREKRIAELEKENADLEEQLENERDLPAIAYMQGAEKQKKKDAEQLTKAKEIIKLLLWDLRNRSYEPVKDVEQAEQFLNREVEKMNNNITNKELAEWLAQGKGEWKHEPSNSGKTYDFYYFNPQDADKQITINEKNQRIVVRKYGDDEWHSPTYDYCEVEK